MQTAIFMDKRVKCLKDNYYLSEDGKLYLCVKNPPTPIKYIEKYSEYFKLVVETILVDDELVKGIEGEYYSNINGNIFYCIKDCRPIKRIDLHPESYRLIYDLELLNEENDEELDERSNDDIMTKKDIPELNSIEEALAEKKRREIQGLTLELEKNELEAKIKNVKDRADIINSSRGFDDYDCNICGTEYDRVEKKFVNGRYQRVQHYNHGEELLTNENNHGSDCHCSKCCPNPNPNFLQRNKNRIYAILIGLIMIVLAVGYSPAGDVFKEIQNQYVELLVNFFKVSLLAISGVCIYQLFKKDKK